MGTFAVQIAKSFGAEMTGVCSRSLTECRRALTPTGTLILSGGGVSQGGNLIGPVGLIIRGKLLSRFIRHRVLVLTATPSRRTSRR